MSAFTEARLEQLFTARLAEQGFVHGFGESLARASKAHVLLRDDLRAYLRSRYAHASLTDAEIERITTDLERLPASDLYASNRAVMRAVSSGLSLKRDDPADKDLFVELVAEVPEIPAAPVVPRTVSSQDNQLNELRPKTYLAAADIDHNVYRFVTQLEVVGVDDQLRIADGVL